MYVRISLRTFSLSSLASHCEKRLYTRIESVCASLSILSRHWHHISLFHPHSHCLCTHREAHTHSNHISPSLSHTYTLSLSPTHTLSRNTSHLTDAHHCLTVSLSNTQTHSSLSHTHTLSHHISLTRITMSLTRVSSVRPATRCNTLQHTATHCNTLQHTATH